MIGKGRSIIYTPYKSIDETNVIQVIQTAIGKFRENAEDCRFLYNFKDGEQPINRDNCEKKVMPWINCETVDNVAKEVYDFWIGFAWGNPISFVQRGDADSDEKIAEGIKILNNQYALSGNSIDYLELARDIEITGVGYTFIDINKEWTEDESYFTRDVLSPLSTFIVRSRYYTDKRVMLAVTLRKNEDGTTYYTAFTKDTRFDIYKKEEKVNNETVEIWRQEEFSPQKNYLGRIPICEWIRDVDRTGVFEAQIDAFNDLNLRKSDISNGTEQNIQAVWWANNVEFPTEEVENEDGSVTVQTKKPKNGDWINTKSPRDGVAPSIKPLTIDYHISEMQTTYLADRKLILQKCHVPMRNSTSGGSSGVAMDSASGWDDAENVASAQENLTIGCQNNEIKVVLAAIREVVGVIDVEIEDSLLNLKARDIQPAIRRPKNYELTNKVNAWAAVVAKGASVEDALTVAPIVPDAAQFIARSGEGIRKYQEAHVWSDSSQKDEEETHMTDLSDESNNTPMIDGLSTGTEKIDVEE